MIYFLYKQIRLIRPIRGRTETSRGQGRIILVYRLAMDARPERVMVWRVENIQACLRDFLAATASIARKRHLTSIARGLFGFCLAPSIRKPIRPIRLIRGKIEIQSTRASHQAKDIVVAPGEPFCTANGSYFVFWGFGRSCKAGLGVAA